MKAEDLTKLVAAWIENGTISPERLARRPGSDPRDDLAAIEAKLDEYHAAAVYAVLLNGGFKARARAKNIKNELLAMISDAIKAGR